MKRRTQILKTLVASWAAWQLVGLPAAFAQAASHPPIPAAIAPCLPAIESPIRLQASTSFQGVNYYDYYVGDADSDDGYDILIRQDRSSCRRLMGAETRNLTYPFSHYIPSQAAYQIWLDIYRQRIAAAGGVAQYQQQMEAEDAATCPCFVTSEEARAMRDLGLRVSPDYQPYPVNGLPPQ
ncbi:hypothetical protein H6F67_11040 [Microcoleus sp. FACHB-1515]|uniref:hypothetical protein n=1 Tax=Cyanophyceae TaxID=3028117 RepID=UPI001684CBE2|nr:hypothetical protein [Microcoleus sp. FACHB-1515]MBD2090389.1 hypothetical protein [Microcoleus sp. FACHB-1515]